MTEVLRRNWNFWATWFGLFRSRTWNCVFGGNHLLRDAKISIHCNSTTLNCIKSCGRVLHSFWQVFNSGLQVEEKLEFASTAQFSLVFDSDLLLFTTARTMNYISNEIPDSELSFDIKFFWFRPNNVMTVSDRMHARVLSCENSFSTAASIRCHGWLCVVQKVSVSLWMYLLIQVCRKVMCSWT